MINNNEKEPSKLNVNTHIYLLLQYFAVSWQSNIYNTSSVYCRELAPGAVSLKGDWVRGDDSKHYRYLACVFMSVIVYCFGNT